jgi:hypothetical protein
MVPSTEKWGIFKHHFVYCQQMAKTGGPVSYDSEIQVPKPRLISPEAKQSQRGDDDTNPAYGKARDFAKEYSYCPFTELRDAMLWRFIRNMQGLIEIKPELFLPISWGGLGLPHPNPRALIDSLPDWHIALIAKREQGDRVAKSILSNWGQIRITHRGAEMSVPQIMREEFKLWIPHYTMRELLSELDAPPSVTNGQYRVKKQFFKQKGYITTDEACMKFMESQTNNSLWELKAKVSRGFKQLSWSERSQRMLQDVESNFGPLAVTADEIEEIPASPRWFDDEYLYESMKMPWSVDPEVPHYLISAQEQIAPIDKIEEGEIREFTIPAFGSFASPRVFLHYDNARLILNATSPQRKRRRVLDSFSNSYQAS